MNETLAKPTVSFWPIIIAIGMGNFVAALSSTTVTIMLPVFMKDFLTDIVTVQWVITGYMLASGMVAPLIGYLADRLSLKRTYLSALIGFMITSFILGFAHSITALIGLRILQGCFGGMIFPLTMSLIYQIIDQERQAFALSIWSVSGVLAPTLGPTVAGILTDLLGWQWVFFFNIPFALLAAIVAVRFIPYYILENHTDQKFDYVGLLTAVVGTFCLLYVFSNITRWNFFSLKCLTLLATGLLFTAFFVYHELHCVAPLLNLSVLKYHNFAWSVVLLCVAQITMNASILVMPIYLQDILGYSTTMAAVILALGPLCVFFFVPVIGQLYHRINAKMLLYILFSVGCFSMLVHRQLDLTSTALFAAIAVLIRDLGVGSVTMPATNMGMEGMPLNVSSHASATSSWIRQCVVSLAIGLINTLITARTQYHLEQQPITTNAELSYNASYILAMHDLFGIIIFVAFLGLFAVSRMNTQKH